VVSGLTSANLKAVSSLFIPSQFDSAGSLIQNSLFMDSATGNLRFFNNGTLGTLTVSYT
jgi:hypothetical protein